MTAILKPFVLKSLLQNIESSGKLYKNFEPQKDLFPQNKDEFGPPGSTLRNLVSRKFSSIKGYSPEAYSNLLIKSEVDPGAALQKELSRNHPPVPLDKDLNPPEEANDDDEDYDPTGM